MRRTAMSVLLLAAVLWVLSSCARCPCAIARGKHPKKSRDAVVVDQRHSLAERQYWMNSLLNLGATPKSKGDYSTALVGFDVTGMLAETWHGENQREAEECAKRLARLEKLIEIEGTRKNLTTKLSETRARLAGIRSNNLDLWILRIRARVAAGEMAEVGLDEDAALKRYIGAYVYVLFLRNQPLDDLADEQRLDLDVWGAIAETKLRRMGVDIAAAQAEAVEKLKAAPPTPYL